MIEASRILVTGADGQLGRAFRKVIPEAMFATRIELDLTWNSCKLMAAVEEFKPSLILHAAAYTNVDGAQSDPTTALKVNGAATGILVECCRKHDVPIIYFSTEYVLNTNPDSGHLECERPNPQSIYGISKYIGELYMRTYGKGTVIRLNSLFGDGKNFPLTMLELAKSRDVISVVRDQYIRPTYALDVAKATRELLERHWVGDDWKLPPILHMQNSGPVVHWADFARHLFALQGKSTRVQEIMFEEYVQSRGDKPTAPRPTNSIFDLTLLNSLGAPLRSWVDALNEFCKTISSP